MQVMVNEAYCNAIAQDLLGIGFFEKHKIHNAHEFLNFIVGIFSKNKDIKSRFIVFEDLLLDCAYWTHEDVVYVDLKTFIIRNIEIRNEDNFNKSYYLATAADIIVFIDADDVHITTGE